MRACRFCRFVSYLVRAFAISFYSRSFTHSFCPVVISMRYCFCCVCSVSFVSFLLLFVFFSTFLRSKRKEGIPKRGGPTDISFRLAGNRTSPNSVAREEFLRSIAHVSLDQNGISHNMGICARNQSILLNKANVAINQRNAHKFQYIFNKERLI